MISEGTDIQRLCVCAYLSRIRTELHYRQVLGRILRKMSDSDDKAWLYVIAEPLLRKYTQRIAERFARRSGDASNTKAEPAFRARAFQAKEQDRGE